MRENEFGLILPADSLTRRYASFENGGRNAKIERKELIGIRESHNIQWKNECNIISTRFYDRLNIFNSQ